MLAAAAVIFCASRYFEQSQDFVDLEGERNEIRRLILLCHKPGEPVRLEESEKLLTDALERAIRIDDPVLQTKASTELLCSLDSDGSSSIPITELQKKLQRAIRPRWTDPSSHFRQKNKQVMARTRERIALMRTDRHTTTADVNRMPDDVIHYARACFNNEATDQLQALRQ